MVDSGSGLMTWMYLPFSYLAVFVFVFALSFNQRRLNELNSGAKQWVEYKTRKPAYLYLYLYLYSYLCLYLLWSKTTRWIKFWRQAVGWIQASPPTVWRQPSNCPAEPESEGAWTWKLEGGTNLKHLPSDVEAQCVSVLGRKWIFNSEFLGRESVKWIELWDLTRHLADSYLTL